jgi:glycosyltransferase involved in cell wall biosynthesis
MLGWALNEEESIGPYILRAEQVLRSVTDDFELIVIDDGSVDRTWEIAVAHRATRPWLRLYRNDTNSGSGYNAKRAVSLAEKDYLFWQTVDWAYDITILMQQLALLDTYNVLQGVRTTRFFTVSTGRHRSDNFPKTLISVTNYLLIRTLFQLPLHDYQNVAVYPRALIQSVQLEAESAFTSPECLLKLWWMGATIKEVPVPFIKRKKGVPKGTRPRAVMAAVHDVFFWWWQWIARGRRPHRRRGQVIPWTDGDLHSEPTRASGVESNV